jgi:starch-binding outer membrane protein, SusD/RagB family
MKKTIIYTVSLLLAMGLLSSCFKDLDTVPLDKDEVTSAGLFENAESYTQFLAKVYAGLTLTGQQGPAGMADIDVADEGFSSYLRQLWVHQEIPTDEAVVAWGDPGLPEYNYQAWTPSSDFAEMMYYRIFYQITLCNEFIREAQDEKLDERGFTADEKTRIQGYRSEARFLRALSYWHALDMFGSVPFVTEEDDLGAFLPEQITKANLFDYIETELTDIEDLLPAAGGNEYGRADQGAVWTLLAKLYLNAEVYIESNRYSDCISYCEKVIGANYELADNYQDNFLADNYTSPEIIFGLPHDGISSKTYGGTTFIVHAGIGGSMNDICEEQYGIKGGEGWGGHRTTPEFVDKFPDVDGEIDSRAMFFTDGQNLEIENLDDFTDGYAIDKFRNVIYTDTDTIPGSDLIFVDIDFPMFRLADVYLMYAEAHLQGGGGNAGLALDYINELRERAYGDDSGNINAGEMDEEDFILNERARELYWEAHRRTDLIRFGKFTSSDYIWSWKGGVQGGAGTDAKYLLYPIPSAELNANPNLTPTPGY